ncbi:bifunctional DNA primase/polymerase [Kineosporia succinea]|uniref:DNA primase/polymerase bifunctional N-terminal domain-containing protein n=1 Tax=Kineosporia succinea TaxID=84632 RepID=A0ABT9P258_9ACTN|nr:bifunctional DNA primase/polymerase [Kineosporia succinea]MDP9826767.1 hypothetical protein [Kineosporia succinea]
MSWITGPHPAPEQHGALVPAALAYAARGWHVFPLRPGDKRPAFPEHSETRCTATDPRCRRAGRHVPWQERATTDPGRIEAAWSRVPFGIGIATGPSDLVVIDLDRPKTGPDGALTRPPAEWTEPGIIDGADVFDLLCARSGQPVPLDTYTVSTGSGGTHLYFAAPSGPDAPRLRSTAGHLGWLVDTRAHGGYVVAPPTIVASRPYRAHDHDAPAAPLPGWLAEVLAPRPAPVAGPSPVRLHGGNARARAYLEAAVNGAVASIHAAGDGTRNRAVYAAAVQLGQLVAGGALSEQTVHDVLTPAARAVGQSDTETVRTIASGLRRGAERPRTLPATSTRRSAA